MQSKLSKRRATDDGKGRKGQKKRREFSPDDNNTPPPSPDHNDDDDDEDDEDDEDDQGFLCPYWSASGDNDMTKSCKVKKKDIPCLKYVPYTN